MLSVEDWTTIRCLNNKGKSIRAISRLLNISRNTVRRALRNNDFPKYKKEKPRKSILDKYKKNIEKMLYVDKFIGSRILIELRKIGYKGGDTTFYDYLKKINGSKNHNKISKPYETESGKQCQFDWSHYTVLIDNKETKIYIFNTILCYSRKLHYTASLRMDQSSVFEAIEGAFQYFGGIPQEILMDNARQMVDNANPLNFIWNRKFYALCGFYGITPKVCKIRTPKTKGKVEKPFQYLENHFIKGSHFTSFKDLENKLADFNENVNNKIHSTIKETPNNRYSRDEKDKLNRLPIDCFHGILDELRKVNWDLLISYKGNRYSVPYHYAGKYVWVRRVKGTYIKVYSNHGKLIAVHEIPSGKSNVVKSEDHYSGIPKDTPKSMYILKEEFYKYFSDCKGFLNKLIEKNNWTSLRHLRGIIGLRKYYADKDIIDAMNSCEMWNRYSYQLILMILKGRCNSPPTLDPSKYHNSKINERIAENKKDLIRNLSYYEKLI